MLSKPDILRVLGVSLPQKLATNYVEWSALEIFSIRSRIKAYGLTQEEGPSYKSHSKFANAFIHLDHSHTACTITLSLNHRADGWHASKDLEFMELPSTPQSC